MYNKKMKIIILGLFKFCSTEFNNKKNLNYQKSNQLQRQNFAPLSNNAIAWI